MIDKGARSRRAGHRLWWSRCSADSALQRRRLRLGLPPPPSSPRCSADSALQPGRLRLGLPPPPSSPRWSADSAL